MLTIIEGFKYKTLLFYYFVYHVVKCNLDASRETAMSMVMFLIHILFLVQ